MESDIADWRKRIDDIDLKLVELLNERAGVVVEIAHCKRRESLRVLDKTREEAVLRSVSAKSAGPFTTGAILRIFRAIVKESRILQKQVMGPSNS